MNEQPDEPLARERAATETVVCDRPVCDREVFEGATVDLVAGSVIGTWDDPEPHVGVAAAGPGDPVVERWCLSCATDRFGIESTADRRRSERVRRYLTASNLAAFLLGVTLVMLVVLLV